VTRTRAERPPFDTWEGLGFFLFTTTSKAALEPTQPPIQWVLGVLSPRIKRPRCRADHSPPSSAKVKNGGSYTSTPQYTFIAWYLVKDRDNFMFPSFPIGLLLLLLTFENEFSQLQSFCYFRYLLLLSRLALHNCTWLFIRILFFKFPFLMSFLLWKFINIPYIKLFGFKRHVIP
jgi:hypothetical protein